MEPIYKSPVISFINKSTGSFFEHAQGDYRALNIQLKELESLILKHQPKDDLVFFYTPPHTPDSLDNPKNNHLLVSRVKTVAGMVNLTEIEPSHGFHSPVIGSQPSVSHYFKIKNFDYTNQLSVFTGLVKGAIGSMAKEYDDHPLLHNHQVEFRRAKYIDNRQAFSFWDAELPPGNYPLSKPLFDNIIEQLDKTEQSYQIKVDFVTDWKKQYSSFNGPPQMFGIEISVFMNNQSFPVIKTECTEEQLREFEHNGTLLDEWLEPMFSTLNAQIPSFYAFLAMNLNSQNNQQNDNNVNKPKIR
jgi:hypothetical protein